MYTRLRAHAPIPSSPLPAQQAMRISNDLYGSYNMSKYGLTHGYSRPLSVIPILIPTEPFEAHATLLAKCKLVRILSSKYLSFLRRSTGDLVEVYVKADNAKRSQVVISSPCTLVGQGILNCDHPQLRWSNHASAIGRPSDSN